MRGNGRLKKQDRDRKDGREILNAQYPRTCFVVIMCNQHWQWVYSFKAATHTFP